MEWSAGGEHVDRTGLLMLSLALQAAVYQALSRVQTDLHKLVTVQSGAHFIPNTQCTHCSVATE